MGFSRIDNRGHNSFSGVNKTQHGVLSKKSNRKVDRIQNILPKNG